MSSINTNGINVNYPTPGVNNNSQGFRDNFASIKTNLNTAATEITDLQNKVVLKQALANSTLNNDMANTLISNAVTRSFRASTYNLGGSLSGLVTIDTSLGDVQYGTITGDTQLMFSKWAPAGTQANVQIQLEIANADATITFPSELVYDGDFGAATIEAGANASGNLTVTAPANVTQLNYTISTVDCGTSLYIEPTNRPRKATQTVTRTPTNIGSNGDVSGMMCSDSSYLYVCTGTYDGSTPIWKRIALSAF